ncbi:MAG: HPr family phosphocarrier protein [Phycisphaerales bacterium]|nr:HPr family phosphocarrier protein [Phycisphaerales bacterium]
MSSQATRTVEVSNRLGLHARPAMLLAEAAKQFAASISIRRVDQDESVDAKSIMQIMMLAATSGTKLEITAVGADAKDAVEALAELVSTGFDEK